MYNVDLCSVYARYWDQFVPQLCNGILYDKTLPRAYESNTYQLHLISFKCIQINDEVKRKQVICEEKY
jgi:hypothetical protein